jgi:uncharacterized protein YbdZ (MbtH family)
LGAALLLVGVAQETLDGSMVAAEGCYSIWADVEKEGSRYRHLVYVRNDCEYWLQCSLWTDANPASKMVSVGPGMTERAETSGDSKSDNPKAFGSCRRK